MKLKLLLTATTIALAAGYAATDTEFKFVFDRDFKFPDNVGKEDDETNQMIEKIKQKNIKFIKGLNPETVSIINCQGNNLKATFVPSKTSSNKYVILSHGYRYNGLGEFGLILPFYYEQNINILAVDHQAAGESEGKYITFGYQESIDIIQWAQYLIERFGQDIDIYLHGISMGAATVCQCAGNENFQPQIKGIISDCPYASAKKELMHTMEMFPKQLRGVTYNLLAKKLESKCQAKLDEVNAIEAIKKCKVPFLAIHGMEDTFVPTNGSIEIFDACPVEDKHTLIVEKAAHAQSYWFAKDRYQQAILSIIDPEDEV